MRKYFKCRVDVDSNEFNDELKKLTEEAEELKEKLIIRDEFYKNMTNPKFKECVIEWHEEIAKKESEKSVDKVVSFCMPKLIFTTSEIESVKCKEDCIKSKKERKLKVGGLYPIKTTYEVLVYKYKGFKNGEHIFLDTQDVEVIVFEDTIKHRLGKRIKFK